MPEKKVVAVCGDLRIGGSEHAQLKVKHPTHLGTITIPRYKLYDVGGKAVVLAGVETDKVVADVFRVGPQGAQVIADHTGAGTEVEFVPDGLTVSVKLTLYEGELTADAKIIESGDWVDYEATRPEEVGENEDEEDDEEDEEELTVDDLDSGDLGMIKDQLVDDMQNEDCSVCDTQYSGGAVDVCRAVITVCEDEALQDIVEGVLVALNQTFVVTLKRK